MSSWTLVYEGFKPDQEGLREALTATGNGVFCTRGAAEWSSADDVHYPGTYLAGGYDRMVTPVAGRPVENEDLVNMPNWLCLSLRIEDGPWLDLETHELLDYRHELSLVEGVLTRRLRVRDREGRVTNLASRRFVSMANPHAAAIEWQVTAENWSGRLEVRSALNGRVINWGVKRYRALEGKHLEPEGSEKIDEESIGLVMRTRQSAIRVAQSARTRVYADGRRLKPRRRLVRRTGYVAQSLAVDVKEGQTLRVEKIVAFYSSRDLGISEPSLEVRKAVGRLGDFDALLADQRIAWAQIWRRCDIQLRDGDRNQMILRLHIFHLLQTVSPNTLELDVGVPARGLHGEAYRGHIFWDDMFILPFLNYRIPEISHTLLLYRYHRLDEARANARDAGYRGAMFPWQSGSSGREETQEVHLNPRSGRWLSDNSRRQRHVNVAIVYNIVQYFRITGHRGFMSVYGWRVIFEIARFFASLAHYNPARERYEIHGVMGPDEYHEAYYGAETQGLKNNAYTNVMVSWVLDVALKLLDDLLAYRRDEIVEVLGLTDEEVSAWADISHRLFVPFHGNRIISQFEGYENLEEFDWEGYRRKYGDIRRLDRILEAEGDSPNRYKLSKQADVLMLFYLFSEDEIREIFARLGYEFDDDMIPRNVEYYSRRTSNGSTLSSIVHAGVMARYDPEASWIQFTEALESDMTDIQGGTTPEGIHLGAMAGTVDLIQRVFMGVSIRDGVLHFDPRRQARQRSIAFNLRFRAVWLDVRLAENRLTLSPRPGGPDRVPIGVRDRIYTLKAGYERTFDL